MAKINARLLTIASCFAVLAVSLWCIRMYANGESKGVIKESGAEVSEVKSAQTAYKIVSTSYFSAELPTTYIQRSATDNGRQAAIQGQYVYSDQDGGGAQVAVTIGRLDGALEELSFIKQRRSAGQDYVFESESAQKVIVRKADQTEYAEFFVSGERYAAVVISTPRGTAEAIEMYAQRMVRSWQWN